jgi:hypothetical protein
MRPGPSIGSRPRNAESHSHRRAPQSYLPAPQSYLPASQSYLPAPQSYLPAPQSYLPAPQSYLSESRRAGKKLNGATPNIIGSAPVPGLRASAVG